MIALLAVLIAAGLAPVQAGAGPGSRQAPARSPAVIVSGEAGALVDALPRQHATELRPEAAVEIQWRPSPWWRAHVDVAASALAADRDGATTAAVLRARDVWIEAAGSRADLRVGFGRLAWGRLDEVQPSDVINPIDSARFFLMGRTEARLPVAFVRARAFLSETATVEAVVAPVFRRGRFDQLDDATSPFNIIRDAVLPAGVTLGSPEVRHEAPAGTWRNISGGARLSLTTGRVDWSVAGYRGFDGFGPVTLETTVTTGPSGPAVVGRLVGRHPRFTMVAADLETVAGEWAWRAEAAFFPERTLTAAAAPGGARGHVAEAGAGFDRAFGATRVFGSVLVHRAWTGLDPVLDTLDVNVVGSIERTFNRERYRARGFAVVNPADASAFLRGVLTWSVRDNVRAEFSAGTFLGDGDDAIARFDGRDFLMAGLKYHF